MAFIQKNGIWRKNNVPTFEIEIDRAHPLALGLQTLVVPGSRSLFRDFAVPRVVTVSSGIPLGSDAAGGGINWDATAGTERIDYGYSGQPPTILTMAAFLRTGANSNLFGTSTPLCSFQDGTGAAPATYDRGLALAGPTGGGGWQPYFYIYDGATKNTTYTFTIPESSLSVVAGVYDGSAITCYANGAPNGTLAAGTPYTGYSNAQLNIGYGNPGARTALGVLNSVYVWSRALSSNENVWLAEEPFAMLKAKISRQFYFMPSSSGGGGGTAALFGYMVGKSAGVAAPGAAVAVSARQTSGAHARGTGSYAAPQVGRASVLSRGIAAPAASTALTARSVAKTAGRGVLSAGATFLALVGLGGASVKGRAGMSVVAHMSANSYVQARAGALGGLKAALAATSRSMASGKIAASCKVALSAATKMRATIAPAASFTAVMSGLSRIGTTARAAAPVLTIPLVAAARLGMAGAAAVLAKTTLLGTLFTALTGKILFAQQIPLQIDPAGVVISEHLENAILSEYRANEILSYRC